jgi:hypothetical protein
VAKGHEGKLIDKVHRQLPKSIYKMKMNMGLGSPIGVADMFYEGTGNDLFIEYKYIPNWDSKRKVPMNMLSANQKAGIERRMEKGRPVTIIIGDSEGRIMWIDVENYLEPVIPKTFMSPKEVAHKIEDIVMRDSIDIMDRVTAVLAMSEVDPNFTFKMYPSYESLAVQVQHKGVPVKTCHINGRAEASINEQTLSIIKPYLS